MTRSLVFSLCVAACLVVGCSSNHDDIRTWMRESERGMRGSVKPLPQVNTFPVVEYTAVADLDPFSPVRIAPEAKPNVVGGPDESRQREPLESYPLESLSMVGVLKQNDIVHALISGNGNLFQIRVGNYLGQNHGIVTKINDADLILVELVEDINGDWVERESTLQLQER